MSPLLSLLVAAVERLAQRVAALADLPLNAPQRLAWEQRMLSAHLQGDRTAFAELYRAYASLVYLRVLLPRLSHSDLAKDALADTFERAHRGLHSVVVTDRSIYFWLCRIAKNLVLDLHRRTALARTKGRSPHMLDERLTLPEPDQSLLCLRVKKGCCCVPASTRCCLS